MEKTVEGDDYLEFSDETLESSSVWVFLAEMAAFSLTVRTAVRGYRPNEKDLGRFAIAELHCRTKRKMNDVHSVEKDYRRMEQCQKDKANSERCWLCS